MQAETVVPDTSGSRVDISAMTGDGAVRAHTYSLLGRLLAAPPSQEMLDLLAGIEIPPDTRADFAECWRHLALAAQQVAPASLDDEYHDLFIGLGRGQVVPYASWYLTGFLMDRPLAVLREDLRRLGVERCEDVSEPEDHAAALCETMAMLCASDGPGLSGQRAFFAAHLEAWLPAFMRDLQGAPAATFYRSVGRLGERFIEFESRYFAMPV